MFYNINWGSYFHCCFFSSPVNLGRARRRSPQGQAGGHRRAALQRVGEPGATPDLVPARHRPAGLGRVQPLPAPGQHWSRPQRRLRLRRR